MAFSVFLLIVMIRFTTPSLLPFLGQLMHVDTSIEGLLVTAYWVGYTAFMIPSGAVVERAGVKSAIIAGIALAAIFVLFPLFIDSYDYILMLQFTAGSLSSLIYVFLVSLIVATQRRSGLAVGIFQSAFFIGSSISIAVTPLLFSFNYVIPFISYGIPLIPLTALLLGVGGEGREQASSPAINAGVVGMGLIRFAAGFSYLGFVAWSTYYSVHVLGATHSMSGVYAFTSTALGSIGTIIGGAVGDRLGYVAPSVFGSSMIAAIVLIIYWLPLPFQEVFMAIMGFMYGFYASPSLASSKSSTRISSVSAFLNFMTQLGGTASPYLIGRMLGLLGFASAFAILGVTSMALIITGSLLLRRPG